MAKVMVPISKVGYETGDVLDLDAATLLHEAGLCDEDEYTYTFRATVPEEEREALKVTLVALLGAEQAQRLIAVLEDNESGMLVSSWTRSKRMREKKGCPQCGCPHCGER